MSGRLDLEDDLDGMPRLIVALDEADATVRELARCWKTFRHNDNARMSGPSPLSRTPSGRGARPASTSFSTGDPPPVLGAAARDQFATVILVQVTADTWRRLAPVVGPAPKQSSHPGRFHVVQHSAVHETQAIVMTDAEVVDWLTYPRDNES
ncbi:hypothetical protein [Streptomyces sp. NPDC014894]|uniref:hypothetical protein n=1 Tax=Streptomyces sp. NPDC014894 TaxID=3364931 RepID=UPI0036F7C3E8